MIEAWEEEQMSNLGCESVSDLIEEVQRLKGLVYGYDKEVKILRELPAEVKRLREVNEMQRKTLLNIEGFLETWRDAE